MMGSRVVCQATEASVMGAGDSFIRTWDNRFHGVKEPLSIRIPGALLRPWQTDDAPLLARYADNPRIAAGMRDGFPSPYTCEDARCFITGATSPGARLLLAIVVRGEPAGGIGITPLEDVYRGTAELGYWLAEPFWGRGIVTDAVRALVPVIFDQPGIIRIQAGVFSTNPASMRVLEKCGFVREAVHRNAITKHGIVMDEVMFVLLKNRSHQIGRNMGFGRSSPSFFWQHWIRVLRYPRSPHESPKKQR